MAYDVVHVESVTIVLGTVEINFIVYAMQYGLKEDWAVVMLQNGEVFGVRRNAFTKEQAVAYAKTVVLAKLKTHYSALNCQIVPLPLCQ